LILFSSVATAATYTVGEGGDYATLELLRTSGDLANGDTIVLNGDDNSLRGSFTNILTFQGTGKITPATFVKFSTGTTMINSDSLELSGYRASTNGGVIVGATTINGGKNTFSDNSAATGTGYSGGVIYGTTNIIDGDNTFAGNRALSTGGAIYGNTSITGGENTFMGNSSGAHGGAIQQNNYNGSFLSGGINTFAKNTAVYDGGAIYNSGFGITTVSNGTNSFTNNTAGRSGGAIYSAGTVSFTGGTNTFTGNMATANGGAIYSADTVSFTGGTNTFTGNMATANGGAIRFLGTDASTFRASNGDITFRGNRDGVGTDSERANAIYAASSGNLTLAARDGQNVYFYDPVASSTIVRTVSINNLNTDLGRVVFDGSDYTREVDRHSEVYGTTTVGYGEMVLNGSAIYGAANNVGSFTLNQRATLSTDATANEIRANIITMNGTVDIASGGTLGLSANGGVNFGSTSNLNIGLGVDSFGFVDVLGNLTFGNGASLSLYWDDNFSALSDGWTNTYSFFEANNVFGLENLELDMSAFDSLSAFTYTWNAGVLTLAYNSEVPEPATLAIIGLGLAGLGLARRRRK